MRQSERTQAIEFLKKHVIGRAVVAAPITTFTDQGRVESVYEDQTFFSNLVETANGFGFDLIVIQSGTLYELDKGERAQPGDNLDAVRVYRYEITERKSSGRLVGFARFISSTGTEFDAWSGTIFLVQLWLQGGELVVQETQFGYGDFVAAGGASKPIASDGRYRYAIEDGKLAVYYKQTTFDVDPETLQRTPTKDQFQIQISKEIGPPPSAAVGRDSTK